jgi:hypothetical protein
MTDLSKKTHRVKRRFFANLHDFFVTLKNGRLSTTNQLRRETLRYPGNESHCRLAGFKEMKQQKPMMTT